MPSSYHRSVSFLSHVLQELPLQVEAGTACLHFNAQPGLYQFTAIADGSDFDWESLYLNLFEDGNKGQRTGPWDFDLTNNNRPLVPAFWVELDGERLGLWFFQRVSLADIEAKRFRGRLAFYVDRAGEHELRFTPYHENPLPWSLARLERDPEDTLLPEIKNTFLTPPPAAYWADDDFWQEKRDLIHGAARDVFRQRLEPIFQTVVAERNPSAAMLPLLLTAWRLNDNAAALHALRNLVEYTVALPHWGNPHEDGYSHDGDMAAAQCLRNLAWVWRATEKQAAFSDGLRERLLQKVLLQGQRFFRQALLNRDYWGGSVLQDHGWRSFFQFGDAALHLLEKIPEARLWARYALPRIDRGLQAMPRDGAIPPSSYCAPNLYLDEMAAYRAARLSFDGDDIYERAPVDGIPRYLHAVLRPQEEIWMTSCLNIGGDTFDFFGGGLFFSQLAAKGHALAATVGHISLWKKNLEACAKPFENSYRLNVLETLLGASSNNTIWREREALPPPPPVSYFADAGLVHYRDVKNDVTFAVRCGPPNGHHAASFATGPCDQMMYTPDAGHFILARANRPLLTTPDFGYSLRTEFRSCLLIDGCGQNASVGYPMSIPSQPYCGGHIESVQWDETNEELRVRLNLAPAYPAQLGVAFYLREFIINRRVLLVRDEVLLDTPRSLAWNFQSKREYGIEIDEEKLAARFGAEAGIRLRAEAPSLGLRISQHETDVVWSYVSSSGFRPFDHVRYETVRKNRHAVAVFRFGWP
jgi:hypothetical protein